MPPKKKKENYTKEMVREAIDDVRNKNISIRHAAKVHNMPESTLRKRLNNPKGADVVMGGPTIFTAFEEAQLADHCVKMAERGYGYTRWQVLELASNMSAAKDRNIEPTKHWFYAFLKRNPMVKMMKPKKRETVRNRITPEIITTYFDDLKLILNKYNLMNQPAKIWNVDETGISLDHSPPKVLSRYGTQPHSVTSGRSSTTTLVAAVSALGQTLPPYIIYKGQRLTAELVSNGMDGTKYNTSSNGWVTTEIFIDFFKNHFLVHITERPLVLLYDGHATHITTEIIEIAKKSDVHLFVLPPHSSHALQPLDVSVFGPFKKSLNTEMHKYMHCNPNSVVTRDLLPGIISTSYRSSMTVTNIMSGFRKTGIFPFDSEIVKPKRFDPIASTIEKPTFTQSRKERKDQRAISLLFKEKETTFEEKQQKKTATKETNKKKRKTFVPPFGAAITEQTFIDLISNYTKEKSKEDEMEKQQGCTSTTCDVEPVKKKRKFQTPYASQTKEISTQYKGKSKKSATNKGKGLAKKSKPVREDQIQDEEMEDNGKCCICGRIQPKDLNLAVAISFVSWAQCDKCDGWVHLKYCSRVTSVSENDSFLCKNCEDTL